MHQNGACARCLGGLRQNELRFGRGIGHLVGIQRQGNRQIDVVLDELGLGARCQPQTLGDLGAAFGVGALDLRDIALILGVIAGIVCQERQHSRDDDTGDQNDDRGAL